MLFKHIIRGKWREFNLSKDNDKVFRELYKQIKLYNLLKKIKR